MHSGFFVALKIPLGEATVLALEGCERPEDLHVTLFYLKGLSPQEQARVAGYIEATLATELPITARLGGIGRFSASQTSDAKDVLYVSVDSPALTAIRTHIAEWLLMQGIRPDVLHGYSPHITIAYIDPSAPTPFRRIMPFDVQLTEAIINMGSEEPATPDMNSVFGQGSL